MMARHCQGHNPWVQGRTEGQWGHKGYWSGSCFCRDSAILTLGENSHCKEKKGNVRKRLNDALLEVFLCVNIYIK